MERDYGDRAYVPIWGRTPLTRLIDAAVGNTLPYSANVEVHQDDLRLILGAFFFGKSPWDLPAAYVDDSSAMARELLDSLPADVRAALAELPQRAVAEALEAR